MDATSGDLTVTLYPASTGKGSYTIIRKSDSSANKVTISDGTFTGVLYLEGEALHLYSDGSEWKEAAPFSTKKQQEPLLLWQQETSNTDAGGLLAAGNWNDRLLNTSDGNTSFLVSLTSSAFTLDDGDYFLDAIFPCWNGDENLLRIQNTTAVSTIHEGPGAYARSAANVYDHTYISYSFTVAAGQALKIQHKVTTAQAGNGAGRAHNLGSNEKYGIVKIWKLD